jgi:hypothetical protein
MMHAEGGEARWRRPFCELALALDVGRDGPLPGPVRTLFRIPGIPGGACAERLALPRSVQPIGELISWHRNSGTLVPYSPSKLSKGC